MRAPTSGTRIEGRCGSVGRVISFSYMLETTVHRTAPLDPHTMQTYPIVRKLLSDIV